MELILKRLSINHPLFKTYNMTKIETHEKCIRILEAIENLQKRRLYNLLDADRNNPFVYYDYKEHIKCRIEITEAMIERLKTYYLKTLNKLQQ